MGDCCNAKTLSYVSAWLQIAGGIIVFISVVLVAAGANTEQVQEAFGSVELATTILVIIGAICLLNFAFLVTLIVGLKQNRITLVKIYLYPNAVMTVLYALEIIASFILGFVNQLSVASVFSKLFVDLLHLGVGILMLSPIFVHFKKMREPRYSPEQYGFCSNQPSRKLEYGV